MGVTVVLTAVDPQNWAAGFKLGPTFFYAFGGPVPGFADMAAADVDGDGQNGDRGGALQPGPARFRPQIVVLGVDPNTLTITTLGATTAGSGASRSRW